MVDGASNDDRSVLAALAVATNFYGGVIELTGSDAFKQKAMRLIIEHNINVRMKHADQRLELDTLRKEMAVGKDAVVTHQPTPELNRNTLNNRLSLTPFRKKKPHNPRRPQLPLKHQPSAPSLHHHRLNLAKRQMRHKVKNHQENFARERA